MGRICDFCSRELPDVPEYVEVDENQELPKNPHRESICCDISQTVFEICGMTAYDLAQQDMLQQGWLKCKR